MSSLELLASGKKLVPKPSSSSSSSSSSYKVKQEKIVIPEEHMQEAFDTLNKTGFVRKWPSVERFVTDPKFEQQKFCLHSFVPSAGAKPDSDGIYGFFKCRGTFPTIDTMNQRAETVIREIDSHHELYHGLVGAPLPFSLNPDYCEETEDIDIKNKAVETVSNSVADSREKDRRTIKELKQREQQLLEDTNMVFDSKTKSNRPMNEKELAEKEKKMSSEDRAEKELDDYIAARVKRATYLFTLVETKKKTDKIKKNFENVDAALKDIDAANPQLLEKYLDKYKKERERVGLEDNNTFIEYLVKDPPADLF